MSHSSGKLCVSIAFLLLLALAISSCKRSGEHSIGSGSHRMLSGRVESTKNPQVASYTIAPSAPADVSIDVNDGSQPGFSTWARRAAGNGAPVTILVAGMRANTRYALRARVHYLDGADVEDTVHWFKTGALPKWASKVKLSVAEAPGAVPEPGLELVNSSVGPYGQAFVTDLKGNILWAYDMPDNQSKRWINFLRWKDRILERAERLLHIGTDAAPSLDPLTVTARREAAAPAMKEAKFSSNLQIVNPVKQLPNGDMLLAIGLPSQSLLVGPLPSGAHSMLREIDLTGKTVRELTVDTLNKKLLAAGYTRLRLQTFHHDVEVLPNGHWIVLANHYRPGTHPVQDQTDIFGDVLIDLDANLNPVWVWDTFDHLDIHRRPMWSSDWTHGNAVIYSPDDGNLIFSMRSQSWIVKIDYRNGKGDGRILWRLGRDGDFRLLDGRNPTDWQYAQHYPFLMGVHSAGVFRLTMMDNGDQRIMPNERPCAEKQADAAGQPLCYTTVPVFEIDEKAMTARIVTRKVFPVAEYSIWGGSADPLPNGDMEAALSSQRAPNTSLLVEYSPAHANQEVWRMQVKGFLVYRARRITSIYPGQR